MVDMSKKITTNSNQQSIDKDVLCFFISQKRQKIKFGKPKCHNMIFYITTLRDMTFKVKDSWK